MEKIKQKKYDYIVLLQPTAPNRAKNEIDKCINKIIKTKADSLISLSPLDEPHPLKLKKYQKALFKIIIEMQKIMFQGNPYQNYINPAATSIYLEEKTYLIET